MEVQLTPETEQKLTALATRSGRRTDELLEDAMAGYLDEVAQVRTLLDNRYDDMKSGRAPSPATMWKPISVKKAQTAALSDGAQTPGHYLPALALPCGTRIPDCVRTC